MGEILVIYGGAPLRTRSDGKYSRLRGSKGWSGAIRMYRRPGFLWQCKLYAQALALQRRRWHPRFESSVASLDRDSALKAHLSATLPWSLAKEAPELTYYDTRQGVRVVVGKKFVSCVLN